MKNYTLTNKLAWEEAFELRSDAFDQSTIERLLHNPESLFTNDLANLLKIDATKDKRIAQYCCNNGRETLAALHFGYSESIGYDIAENMIEYANKVAKRLSLNARFYATDLLKITPPKVLFDTGLLTVGAMCWFEDLKALFSSISSTLKRGAHLIIEDSHPFCNMLAEKGDSKFVKAYPNLPVIDYFKTSPWIENTGMGYMATGGYESKTFISYSHTISSIFNALIENGFIIEKFIENPIDQSSLFPHLDNKGLPLTYLLVAKKQ
jgi:SAM-dependent methyltransferase